ncbi:5-(carboxyamino)imidazole ribonucleotide mutase [Lutispora thermophila]|uniref:N5-carboxyaminoimidazole ribonucleotide mutase n=1 Tax=Lutispora thermophila DSM 19022 TaxID=1122184 RepID=A0A1M6AXJ6_9FIRM|nr:5-(carboxyamino)imidazole ribonucleotide mutase [Lutispora thermophila]SHI41131.1 5-(carboxyamino)imidazole ribonucleotide mutase [Lutispora thermophila DSM 19022]
MDKGPKVAIVMGSDSDLPIVSKTMKILKEFNVDFEARVISAHRTPDRASNFAKEAEEAGFDVIIAAAGKAAHLPGVLAAYTTLPVIGIPIKSSALDGMDALLSIVQMPSGIPVATVGIDGAENAGLLAVEMLSIKYENLRQALKLRREVMAQEVIKKDENLKVEEF